MEKLFKSTRGNQTPIDFYTSILQGIASDGGLLVPDFDFEKKNLEELLSLNYVDLATEIISTFAPSDAKEALHTACNQAYGEGLFCDEVVPVKKAGNVYVAELYQCPTAAFKDMALSMLPRMMTLSLKKKGEEREVMILAATSGDTGKAALEGNFDDAQSAVKKAFGSKELKELCDEHHIFLSSANSINIGRLIPQIVYYFYSYLTLVKRNEIKLGEAVNFTVPSGNFGNCLAGWIAKNMGLPVNQFIVASNKNNILTDFFTTGTYDARREFYKTNAPAMDILVSSNLERLVWFMVNGDSEKVNKYMEELKETGVYKVDDETLARVQKEFKAGCLGEEDVLKVVHDCWNENKYLLDTHTAVGYGVYEEYVKNTGDTTKTILLSTASPYKFPESVYQALTGEEVDVYTAIEKLHDLTGMEISYPLKGIKDREILHKGVIDRDAILDTIAEKIKEY